MYILLVGEQLKASDINWHYSGLKICQFEEIYHNDDFSQAVFKLPQMNLPEGITEITEAEYNQYKTAWKREVIAPEPQPTETEILRDYVLDLDYRLIMIELGL